MKKKLMGIILATGMLLAGLAGCETEETHKKRKVVKDDDSFMDKYTESDPDKTEKTSDDDSKPTTTDPTDTDPTDTDPSSPVVPSNGDHRVGISLPTKFLQRWVTDGDTMRKELEQLGYIVDLIYADNDVQTQNDQISSMISAGCEVLIVAAIDGYSLRPVMDDAEALGIEVIAYDRMIMDTSAVSYYITYSAYETGQIQGEYIQAQLDLDNKSGPFYMEIFAGDPSDIQAEMFYNGAMDVLYPYISDGTLVVSSNQIDFDAVATDAWRTDVAQSRMENILSVFYSDRGSRLDAVLCSNDSVALGVANALDACYTGDYPIITGQDCDIANVKNILNNKQSMSIFKDTRNLAEHAALLANDILLGRDIVYDDERSYNNGVMFLKTCFVQAILVTKDNYHEALVDSGFYTDDDLS